LLVTACRSLAESNRFQNFVMGVIVLTAVLMGLETSASVQAAHGPVLHMLNIVIQAIFVCELSVRLLAHGPRWGTFFRDGWNLFDFIIVAASLLPQVGAFAVVSGIAPPGRRWRQSPQLVFSFMLPPRRSGGSGYGRCREVAVARAI
jgi:hypothetical protein